MKTAIVDTKTTGHHLEYLYGLCSQINKTDPEEQIDVYCDSNIYNYIEENDLAQIRETKCFRLKTDILEQPKGNWFQISRIAYQNIKKLYEYDEVIFLTLNIYFTALLCYGFLFNSSFKFSGIFFNPHARKNKGIKNWFRNFTISRLLKKYNCRIFVLNDDEAVDVLNERYATDKFEVLPDPIPEFYYKDNTKDGENSVSALITFTMIGSIRKRKGIFEFLNAIELSNSSNHFLIAGHVSNDISKVVKQKVNELQDKGYKIELIDKILTNIEFAKCIVNTDVLVIPYLTKGASSGIIGHAAYTHTPVIGPSSGFLSEMIEKYGLGVTVNPKDYKTFSEYIDQPTSITSIKNTGMRNYIKEKSFNIFSSKLLANHFKNFSN